jgi:hypothetical protein
MAKRKNKGSGFEREICKQLGLWWSKGKRDDIFWRSANSGGRATVRHRSGQGTFGQYGDIQATDPCGQALIDVCTIELKRGYSKENIHNLLDSRQTKHPKLYEKFILQASADSKKAKSKYWMLIAKRDQHVSVVYIPMKFYRELKKEMFIYHGKHTNDIIKTTVRLKWKKWNIFGCRLDEFLSAINPKVVKRIGRRYGKK